MRTGRPDAITKELSRNDTGDTGGHQAGMHVPKIPEILAFFPPLGTDQKNPRHVIQITDQAGTAWTFSFIYYNNKFYGGTRNEYRLTHMTEFMRSHSLQPGDSVSLHRNSEGIYTIKYARKHNTTEPCDGVLHLGTTWKVVNI